MTEDKIKEIVNSCMDSVKTSNIKIIQDVIDGKGSADQVDLMMTLLYNTVSSVVSEALIKFNQELH